MRRAITGFHRDEVGDWVAELDCGHAQHVRHKPPFTLRPWVTSERGRIEKLGECLSCVRCDRFELPETVRAYRSTPEFTEQTIPRGLLADHATATGVWGRIHVHAGELHYQIEGAPELDRVIAAGEVGIVAPERRHRVRPLGAVRFSVEFMRVPR